MVAFMPGGDGLTGGELGSDPSTGQADLSQAVCASSSLSSNKFQAILQTCAERPKDKTFTKHNGHLEH